ncbi:hypothetical protein ACRALDRAFT_2099596 [Sodiomyces alcalophilus JCM 7366]|uniref:uncharacterized protein n=1 Tax=Sodiomyces alcalophilus JCM 7366 TaxID=591952 RepID=UPI0039B41053
MPDKYILVSLPLGIFDSDNTDEALSTLSTVISVDNATTRPFPVPDFKIGTLDTLVQQADDLAKLEAACESVVTKVAEALQNVMGGDEEKVNQQKMVNDKPTDQYLNRFSWNKVRYRADKPIGELVDILRKELITIDNDVKGKLNQHKAIKNDLTALQRKQTGNLSTKSLTHVVDPTLLVQGSEYLETHLIVVPVSNKKDFLKSYETLSPMVVPRSSVQVAQDEDFTLFAITTFKKTSAEFLQKCRERKWTPRHYKHIEGGREEEQQELNRVAQEERKSWGETLRIGRTGWSESVMIWLHVLTLRVFVEAVLRYGLPLDYVSALVKTTPKQASKVRSALDSEYSYLGGNAFDKDKRGRVTKDDAKLTSELAAAGIGGAENSEYTAYVYYEFVLP